VNAYHQPGVEAGKKAATRILQLQPQVLAQLSESGKTSEEIARAIGADPEDVYHVLRHLAPNDSNIRTSGDNPGTEKFHVAN
jgi:glucose-6-phosphate isomerase